MEVPVNDYIELAIECKNFPGRLNPFTEVSIVGTFYSSLGTALQVNGFCDSPDGRRYLIRFMPEYTGAYTYNIKFNAPGIEKAFSGKFTAMPSPTKGVLEVSKEHPRHFKHRNSDAYFFWNSTTAYWMSGWKDTAVIDKALDRLASYGINRIRVAINGRSHGGKRWSEDNVVESPGFSLMLNPWIAEDPSSLDAPNFDVSRMNIGHWRVLDHILNKARSRHIVVSLIFYADGLDHACDPFKLENMGNEYEQLYYRYAINRFGSCANLMWDIANEYHLFRTPEWAEKMGAFVRENDPYRHLISVHGSGDFPFRKSDWADIVMFQSWDECGGFDFIAEAISVQEASGFPKPVVNEEYGYEGHYPPWGCGATAAKERPDGRSGLNRSQLAWEICMAGGYQTTGETAEYGTGAGEDTGGGWINGRGNDKMTMLRYYQIMKDCFEKTQYWLLQPASHLVSNGNFCLANVGQEYLVYTRVQHCRLQLPPDTRFSVLKIDPQTGRQETLPDADANTDGQAWQYRKNLSEPTVFILKKI